MSQVQVKFTNIAKKYENSDTYSVKNFELEIHKGEFIVFVGPSGCGKSTTLRMLAGFEEITDGTIEIEGTVVNNTHPKDRNISMVFQNYALYPHLSVAENMTLALKVKKVPKEEIEKKLGWAAEILGLEEYLKRKPKDLSGGQRQRVALGRAIVREPKVFLMDEPLSNLDAKLRVSMRNELTKLHKSLNATTIYVTHDQIEAMTMADRIVVMNKGEIQQIGTPIDLYETPANEFVASFIGTPQMNVLDITLTNGVIDMGEGKMIKAPAGFESGLADGEYRIGIRPEHLPTEKIALDTYFEQVVECEIDAIERMGRENFVYTQLCGKEFVICVPYAERYEIGDKIAFVVDVNQVHFFNKETGKKVN